MKNIIFILCGLFLLSCSKNEPMQVFIENNTIFYEDEAIMSDLSKETRYVDSVLTHIKGQPKFARNSNEEAIPLNRKQFIKFMKCMNVCSDNQGKLSTVFVSKKDNSILSLDSGFINYNIIDKKELFNMLRMDEIDFKIIKKNKAFPYITKNSTSRKINYCEEKYHEIHTRGFEGYDNLPVSGKLYVKTEIALKRYDPGTCASQHHLPEVNYAYEYISSGTTLYEHKIKSAKIVGEYLTLEFIGVLTVPIETPIGPTYYIRYLCTTTGSIHAGNVTSMSVNINTQIVI